MTRRNGRRGSVMMEFVITMPILVVLVLLVVQFAQLWTVRQMVSYSAFCAARSTLSANPISWSIVTPNDRRCDHAAAARVLAWVALFGSGEGEGGKKVPGWGTIPASDKIDSRIEVKTEWIPGQYTSSTVVFQFPLLVPVAGPMISFLAKHSADESRYMKSGTPATMWSGEEELFDEVPSIELTETCVLPMPFNPMAQPLNAYPQGGG